MAVGQQFLFAPEQPIVERLGAKFFRRIPRQAGVYKMRDAGNRIVYVGKARDLRQRLASYRVANPERLGRRHLRLLRQVTHIEFELCASETAALKKEAKLIRQLRPKFNRAGIWPATPRFFTWRFEGSRLELAAPETPLPGWQRGALPSPGAARLRATLAPLLWLAGRPGTSFQQLPHGWLQGRMTDPVGIECGDRADEIGGWLEEAFWGEPTKFLNGLVIKLNGPRSVFERSVIAGRIEELQKFFERHEAQRTPQMELL